MKWYIYLSYFLNVSYWTICVPTMIFTQNVITGLSSENARFLYWQNSNISTSNQLTPALHFLILIIYYTRMYIEI